MPAQARLCVAVAAMAVSAACAMGPNYKRPAVETPPAFRGDATATIGDTRSIADTAWADLFRDETLTTLVTTALDGNFELRIAAGRVLQARELLRIQRADRLPIVDASAAATSARVSTAGANAGIPPGVDPDVSFAQVGFNLNWELDVWGRLRRLREAARAEYFAAEEFRRGVVATLIADVIETYLTLRSLDRQAEIARRTREIGLQGLRLTEARRAGGVASALDVRQAEQLLYTAGSQIAGIEREIELTENALGLLLGRAPHDIPRGQPFDALDAPPAVPPGLPSSLLERRPDIRRAEQELIAANARIGAAKAELFPRISLTGFFGFESRALSDLLSGPARTWTASAGALAPIFDAGRTRANVRLSEAVQREAVVNYQRVIHTALREVSDALAAYRRTGEQRAQQERLVEALRESTRLAAERYRGGLESYLPVLDAQRSLFEGELELARLRRQELSAIVQLYRALGGGWNAVPSPVEPATATSGGPVPTANPDR
ncbi:MAG TPA: efflux transporter outer membrane subunit [Vicinamibacterales bacterium]|nr:efflux transporter outer membrane subunit [Vicinamibacterales bacterium]